MPLTLLVSAVSLTLSAHADSVRAVAKPVTSRATPAPVLADSMSDIATYDARFPADSIVVEKSAHRLSLFQRGRAVRTYLVALGQQPVGDKARIGDLRTPEGTFTIEARNPASR